MEAMLTLIGLFLLVTVFMPWVNHFRLSAYREELRKMSKDIRALQQKLGGTEGRAPTSPPPSPVVAAPVSTDQPTRPQATPQPVPRRAVETPQTSREEKTAPKENFEFNIGTKLPVWIGAISLIFAAFFLVKYSIEAGWLGPAMRVTLGALFGAGLTAAGQWVIRRPWIANYERIAQGLVGAGIVSLYVSLYAAINLYALVPSSLGFCGMTVITALAVIMSLRHGQPIAVFGLIGGLLTPAMVGSPEPDALSLFVYLFLLFSFMLFILARKGWWLLAAVALMGVLSWTGFWFMIAFSAADSFIAVLFVMAVCAVVLFATKEFVVASDKSAGTSLPAHGLNFLAIGGGVLTITWLSLSMMLSLFDWSMLGLLSLACMALAYFRPAVYRQVLWAKLGAGLVLFFMWAHHAPLNDALAVVCGLSAIYAVLPYFIMRRVHDPRAWAAIQVAASVALYVISYAQIDLPAGYAEGGFWGITGMILAGLAAWQAKESLKYEADATIRDHLVALYALASTAFISLALSIELPRVYVPVAFAAQVAATMWVYRRTGIESLKKIAVILTCIFISLNYEQIELFASLALHSIADETLPAYIARDNMLSAPLINLGLPSLFMALALWLHGRQDGGRNILPQALFGTALMLALGTFYYLARDLFQHAPDFFAIRAGFIERSVISITLGASGLALLSYADTRGVDFMRPWGKGLFHAAILRIAYFDLLLLNPFFERSQFVGDWPLLNGVTLTYGTGILLSLCAGQIFDGLPRRIYKVFGLGFLLALVSLTVRQYFHGGFPAIGETGNAEIYAYSIAWLLTGLGLLSLGIVRQSKTLRVASLAFMVLTVGKVFLVDAAELEGLYRVFSFLGLGLSLIGLSYFYTRFILRRGDETKAVESWWF